MSEADRHFWPYKPRVSILLSIVLLIVLLVIVAMLRMTIDWPNEKNETTILIGVLVFSLLPVFLALVDVIIDRGSVIEYGGVKIDFSKVAQMGVSAITVPVNIGVRGEPVKDSSTTQILDSLRKAMGCDAAIIDLEEGQAWWETRLLVLLAGAERLKKPEKIVFVGTNGGKKHCFQGWAHAKDLLPLLLSAHPQYRLSYQKAMAASRQWMLVEPTGDPTYPSPQPPFVQTGLAGQHPWMAFDNVTGLPNELLAEQLLATDLGTEMESQEQPKGISLIRLKELFNPVLIKVRIDENWSAERQMDKFFDSDSAYIAITKNNEYSTLMSRMTALNTVVKELFNKGKGR